jgi:NAD(P)-dependent dehydrogenase (short-subunit alcohol dehydrogenase family)
MSKTVWLITGAGRGMGTDIAKAALATGHAVVATGRDPERVTAAIGAHDDLLAVKLDVTNPDDATAAAQAAVDRFGRVDVLVKMRATSSRDSSRRSAPVTSGHRSRRIFSAR